jgi:hypothetical protein
MKLLLCGKNSTAMFLSPEEGDRDIPKIVIDAIIQNLIKKRTKKQFHICL